MGQQQLLDIGVDDFNTLRGVDSRVVWLRWWGGGVCERNVLRSETLSCCTGGGADETQSC